MNPRILNLASTPTWPVTLVMFIALTLITASSFADPPARVARLSVLSGEVSLASSEDDDWQAADLNRPLGMGDRVVTQSAARAELDLGTAVLRLDGKTELRLTNIDDRSAQIELPEGTLNLTVRKLYDDQSYEIDTPTLALIIREPGAYRIDARRGATQVTLFDGAANVYGDDNAQQRVTAGQSYRFPNASLSDYEVFDVPQADDFDNWCFARDARYNNLVARRYVSEDVVGYADLDDYGDWREESSYGAIWYPHRVVSGWAPYRDGHWAWLQPWGWTWIDAAPWGFAPSHYGRWVFVSNRWGWLPGPRNVRPVYAPAVVAFIGGNNWSIGVTQSSSPVGWYPLGPQDIYEPPYQVSQNYFREVNITNIHNTTVINKTTINTVYNDYSTGRSTPHKRHTYRNNLKAVTAVERDTFVNAKPVARAQRKLNDDDLQRAEVIATPAVRPTRQSQHKAEPRQQPRSSARPSPSDEVRTARPAQPPSAQAKPSRTEKPLPVHAPREHKPGGADQETRGKYSRPAPDLQVSKLAAASAKPSLQAPPARRSQDDRSEKMRISHSERSASAAQTLKPRAAPEKVSAPAELARTRPATTTQRTGRDRSLAAPSPHETRDPRDSEHKPQRSSAPSARQAVAQQPPAARDVEQKARNANTTQVMRAASAAESSDDPGVKTKNPRSNKRGSDEQTRQQNRN